MVRVFSSALKGIQFLRLNKLIHSEVVSSNTKIWLKDDITRLNLSWGGSHQFNTILNPSFVKIEGMDTWSYCIVDQGFSTTGKIQQGI